MKRSIGYLLIISCFLVCCSLFFSGCPQTPGTTDQEKTKLILVHPSLKRLKSFVYLLEHKIIDIPRLEVTVVCYAKADSDFDDLRELLKEKGYSHIHLQKVDGDLTGKDLYQMNSCSRTFHELFRGSDGIIFFGGDDLPPAVYGEKTSLLTRIEDLHRHYFELSFLFHLLGGSQDQNFLPYLEERPDYVIYGFCLGLQTMNVATGGSLYQDIPSEIYGASSVEDVLDLQEDQRHRNYWHDLMPVDEVDEYQFHRIRFVEDRFFMTQLKLRAEEHPLVCSAHHQGIKEIGQGFVAAATSLDGKTIEAITHRKYRNVLGVQFHPEIAELYEPEGTKYMHTPKDAEPVSKYDIVKKDESLSFHKKFWQHFSLLFHREGSN